MTSLKQLTEEERRIRGLESIPAWPVYQKENPLRSDYWNDLDGFREMIVRDVEDFWQTFHTTVEQVLQPSQP